MRAGFTSILVALLFPIVLSAQEAAAPAKFPFLDVDVNAKVIKVESEALDCKNPLEFFLCSTGTNEHESVLRSKVKPSHLHAALLMIGQRPGEPVHFNNATREWSPPHGPPLHLMVQFAREGKTVELPAYRLMRDLRSKKEMPPLTWIFAGSRVMENGVYAADRTGYLVSVVNFDLTMIDTPRLASNANEALLWETNTDVSPPAGTAVTLVITPAGPAVAATQRAENPTGQTGPIDQPLVAIDVQGRIRLDSAEIASAGELVEKLAKSTGPDRRVRVAIANAIEENPAASEVINALSRARIAFLTIPQASAGPAKGSPGAEDVRVRRLREQWEQSVAPRTQALQDAAKTHYQVIAGLRAEQQRLVEEADRIQRMIDELEKRYQELTTPQPPP